MQTQSSMTNTTEDRRTKTVAINPVSLLEASRVVGEIFHPDWKDRHLWNIQLESGKPRLFHCDFVDRQIGITKAHFANRDELRSIIIVLMSIARLGYSHLHKLDDSLRIMQHMAEFINRSELAFHIADSRQTLATLLSDMSCNQNGVIIYDWPMEAVDVNLPASDYDVMVDDSLRDSDIKRILTVEKKLIEDIH